MNQCCGSDPGSGAFLPLDPGYGVSVSRITDHGSRIPDPKSIFKRALSLFGFKYINFFVSWLKFFRPFQKIKCLNFVNFMATKK
jgi:hypothetical protein